MNLIQGLPAGDQKMAAMLVRRDAKSLANSLAVLTGESFAHWVFGIGVIGMAISSIIILMLINGFTLCEMLGLESKGWPYRIGALLPGITGLLGAQFIWGSNVKFWLAVPTSKFGMVAVTCSLSYFPVHDEFEITNGRQNAPGWEENCLECLDGNCNDTGNNW